MPDPQAQESAAEAAPDARGAHALRAWTLGIAAWAALCAAAAFAGDYAFIRERSYYEIDGQALISGAMRLSDAKRGNIPLYKYEFQPLSYELLHAAYGLFKSQKLIWYLPSVFGCAGLVFLFVALRLAHGASVCWLVHLALLSQVPELAYTVLYTNTTALGLPFFAAALLAVIAGRRDAAPLAPVVVAACAFVLAFLFRFEFALAGPLLLVLSFRPGGGLRRPAAFLATAAALIALAWATGAFRPAEILTRGDEQVQFMAFVDWTPRNTASLVASLFSPFFWAIIAASAWIRVALAKGSARWCLVAMLAALAPFLAMTRYLTTPKYLVPVLCLAPLLASSAIALMSANSQRAGRLFAGAALFFGAFSQAATFDPETLRLSLSPRPIETHDCARGYGSYLAAYSRVAIRPRRGQDNSLRVLDMRQIADAVLASDQDVTFVYREGTWHWRYFAYHIAPNMFDEAGYNFSYLAEPARRIELERDGRKVSVFLEGEDRWNRAKGAGGVAAGSAILLPHDEEDQAEVNMMWEGLDRLRGDGEQLLRFRFGRTECSLSAGGELRVEGWALCAYPIDRIVIRAGKQELGEARLGLPRPDVAARYPQYGALDSGFSFLAASPADASAREIEIRFYSDGMRYRTVTLPLARLGEPPGPEGP